MVKFESLKNLIVESGIERKRIAVVPHWLDVQAIYEKSRQNLRQSIAGFGSSDIVFAYFGRLDPWGGPFLLLKAFAAISTKVDNAKLVFIGGGQLHARLKQFCAKNDLSNKVLFLGMIPYTEVHRFLSIPDVVVSSHRFMNYNWALLEAMCTKKPIIATRVFATTEILKDGFNALLAEPTKESLSSKMMRIICDPKLGRTVAERAFKTVRSKHSLKNLEKYEELICSI